MVVPGAVLSPSAQVQFSSVAPDSASHESQGPLLMLSSWGDTNSRVFPHSHLGSVALSNFSHSLISLGTGPTVQKLMAKIA